TVSRRRHPTGARQRLSRTSAVRPWVGPSRLRKARQAIRAGISAVEESDRLHRSQPDVSRQPQFQLLPRLNRSPLFKELPAESPHLQNLGLGEWARSELVELFGSPEHSRTPLGIEEADDPLYFNGFGRKRTARAFTGGILPLPPFGDQAEEPAPVTKRRLDRVMRQIVQREMRAVLRLLLPGYGTILSDAPQHAHTIRPLGNLNP